MLSHRCVSRSIKHTQETLKSSGRIAPLSVSLFFVHFVYLSDSSINVEMIEYFCVFWGKNVKRIDLSFFVINSETVSV